MKPDKGRARGSEIMTLFEAADYLHTSYSTVYRLVTEGELRAFKMRNSWRTSEAACEAYVSKRFAEQAATCGVADAD